MIELDLDIINTNILTKFHEDWAKNVALSSQHPRRKWNGNGTEMDYSFGPSHQASLLHHYMSEITELLGLYR